MKTIKIKFDDIINKPALIKALNKAAKDKSHKHIVRWALHNPEKIVDRLLPQLQQGTWRPNRFHTAKEIFNSGKIRTIICPSFINEQIVHHALIDPLLPFFFKRFYNYSCSSVSHEGIFQVKEYVEKNLYDNKYYIKLDIRKFFQSIKPVLVFKVLRRYIKDKRILLNLSYILRRNKIIYQDGTTDKRGLLLGFYTSPFFANILLNDLDHLIKEV